VPFEGARLPPSPTRQMDPGGSQLRADPGPVYGSPALLVMMSAV